MAQGGGNIPENLGQGLDAVRGIVEEY